MRTHYRNHRTPNADINRGRLNVWVGFAPLKPAEYVPVGGSTLGDEMPEDLPAG